MQILKTLRHVLFRDRVTEYLDSRRDLRAGYWLATESYLRRAVTFADPADFLASLPPVAARRARAALSGYYQWLGCPDRLPSLGRLRSRKEPAGSILDLGTLRAIVRAPPTRFGHIAAVLALTGCRRNEIGGLEPGEVRLDLPLGPRLELPPHRTKQGRWHLVPLSPPVLALLEGHRPFSGWSKGLACHPVQGWTCHDLRRSAATHWADLGLADADLIELALGHRRPGVAGVYNRAIRWPDRVALATRWAAVLAGVGTGRAVGTQKTQ